MANLSNSYNFTNGYGNYTIGVSLDYEQSRENNTSTITNVIQTITNNRPNMAWPYGTISYEVSIDKYVNNTWQRILTYPGSQSINLNNSTTRTLINSARSDLIQHNEDGSCRIRVNYGTSMSGVSSGPTGSSSFVIDLPKIPRASVFGEISDFIIDSNPGIGQAFQVPVIKSVNAYYDVLTIKTGTTTIKTIDNYITSDSGITLTSAELNTIYGKYKETSKVPFTFVVNTYTDDSKGTLVGTTTSKEVEGTIYGIPPTYSTSNITYVDSNTTTSSFGYFIKGYSTLKVTLKAKATVSKQADSNKTSYVLKVNNVIFKTIDGTSTFPYSFEVPNLSSNNFEIDIIDSRENQTSIPFTISNFVDYVVPSISNLTIARTNTVDSQVTLSIEGTYTKIGNNLNKIKKVQFQSREVGSSTWSSLQTVATDASSLLVQSDGNYSILNYVLGNFDISKEFEFKVIVTDALDSISEQRQINSAEPLEWLDRSKKVIGVGKKPEDTIKKGSIDVAGGFYVNGEEIKSTKVNNEKADSKLETYSCDYLNNTLKFEAESGYFVDKTSGFIFQWGMASGSKRISFPIKFPNRCLLVTTGNFITNGSNPTYMTINGAQVNGNETFDSDGFNYASMGYVAVGGQWVSLQSMNTNNNGTPVSNFGGKGYWFAIGY